MWRPDICLIFVFFIFFNSGHFASGGLPSASNGLNSIQEESETEPPPTIQLGPSQYSQNMFEPYFDIMTPRNITALVGKSAYLSCRVRNLGNKTVSWIRHRDIHILTVASYTYTSDQRFQANHHTENDEWTLQIKWAQKRDAGIYECQVSTQPVRSYFVNLNVVDVLPEDEPAQDESYNNCQCLCPQEKNSVSYVKNDGHPVPTAEILGGPDLHVDKGSTINLTCSIKFSPEPPAYIFWYHFEDVISYDSSRGGVSVITEKGDITTSFLLIQHADLADSGKYSCSPSNAEIASVRVHVLNGEMPAAMQTGSARLSKSTLNIAALLIISYIYQMCAFHHCRLLGFASDIMDMNPK